MAQNRKHQAPSVRFGPAMMAVLLCLLIGGAAVGYVWQKSQIDLLGRERKKLEQRLAVLQANNEKLHRQLAALRSPGFLQQRARELGLAPVQPTQVLSLSEPVAGPMVAPTPTQLAIHAPLVRLR